MRLAFPLGWMRDEVFERMGWYWGDGRAHAGRFLDGRALAFHCDARGSGAYVMWGRRELWRREDYLAKEPRTVWIRSDALTDFTESVLPVLNGRIVLVTAEGDYSPFLSHRKAAETLLASDKVAHWFCSQCDIPAGYEKLTRLPLGVPYPYRNDILIRRTREKARHYRLIRYDTAAFDQALSTLMARRPALTERRLAAFADFAFNNTSRDGRFGETRQQIAQRMAANPNVVIPQSPLSQHDLYEAYTRHAFVVSPHGGGLDCYRTWEAVLMGAIPIVRRSAVDPVYDGFPVVSVDDWSEITAANLALWSERFSQAWQGGNIEDRLSLRHWTEKIDRAADAIG